MDIKNNSLAIGVLALIIGLAGGYWFGANGAAPSESSMSMHGAMSGMMTGLEGKTGDQFDKAFLSEMVTHHEGAVAMAQAALQNAKHSEIKQMAQAIISAQTAEIGQMQEWQRSWYGD